jgi:hypothetical protein
MSRTIENWRLNISSDGLLGLFFNIPSNYSQYADLFERKNHDLKKMKIFPFEKLKFY